MIGHRYHLATEKPPGSFVRLCGHVGRNDVYQLVIHQEVESLGRRDGFERRWQWRYLQDERISRHRTGRGVAVV